MGEPTKQYPGVTLVKADAALGLLAPGMRILVGSGPAEPRTMLKRLLASEATHLADLEILQPISLADTLSEAVLGSRRLRLKTFFAGGNASDAIRSGRADLIPCRFSRIPELIRRRVLELDAVILQVTPPDRAGFCSLGLGVDVAREGIDQARVVLGELSDRVPRTYGDTLVHVSEFDALVRSEHGPIVLPRAPFDGTFDRIAAQVASLIEDGSCLAYALGPLFDALGRHLVDKRHLGVHTGCFTDALMDLVECGAVSNLRKSSGRGRSVATYALGTSALYEWLDRNPLIELRALDRVCDPARIGRNDRVVMVLPARRVDLTGRVAFPRAQSMVAAGPAEGLDFLRGAELSRGGRSILALPSRNRAGAPNILPSLEGAPQQVSLRESLDLVVTEQGVANLRGRTIRERAQALIEIAHPGDRAALVERARRDNLLFPDQIFLDETAHLIPMDIDTQHSFGEDVSLRFRALRPSDEEGMRRLFYRCSSESVYRRFCRFLPTMPHEKMQTYVNVDYRHALSIVALEGLPGQGRIVAEARFIGAPGCREPELAVFVDERRQGIGVGTFMTRMLVEQARQRGLTGLTAYVLASNRPMVRVIESSGVPVQSTFDCGAYEIRMDLGG